MSSRSCCIGTYTGQCSIFGSETTTTLTLPDIGEINVVIVLVLYSLIEIEVLLQTVSGEVWAVILEDLRRGAAVKSNFVGNLTGTYFSAKRYFA